MNLHPEPHARVEERLVARIPDGWGSYLRCGEGWYGLLDELDTELAALFPDYQLYQCKEKFGSLRYYTDIGEGVAQFACCDAWEATDPYPGPGTEAGNAEDAWAERWEDHAATAVHRGAQVDYDARVERATEAIRRAEQRSATTCEICGAPGTAGGTSWAVQVRCAQCAAPAGRR